MTPETVVRAADRTTAPSPLTFAGCKLPQFTGETLDVPEGAVLPCQNPERAYLWFSTQLAERQSAARRCDPCPVRQACFDMARANRERFGVWGGRDFQRAETRRRSRAEYLRKREAP